MPRPASTIGEVDKDLQRSMEAFRLYEEKYPPTDLETDEHVRFMDVGVVRVALELLMGKFFKYYQKRMGFDTSEDMLKRFKEFKKYVK